MIDLWRMKRPNNNLIPLIESSYSAGIAIGGYDSNRGAAIDNVIVGNTLANNDTDNSGNGELIIQVDASNNKIIGTGNDTRSRFR